MDVQFIALIVILAVLLLWLAYSAIKIVAEYERLVVFRLGRVMAEPRGPGIVWLWPIIDRPVRVDLREQFLEIPQQSCITSDNAPILIDFLIYWKVTNPHDSVVQVANFAGASQGIATTTLRAVIGDISLDDVLAKTRADQQHSPREAGRSYGAMGRQGDNRGNPRNPAAA